MSQSSLDLASFDVADSCLGFPSGHLYVYDLMVKISHSFPFKSMGTGIGCF